jgi:hypothetical protein
MPRAVVSRKLKQSSTELPVPTLMDWEQEAAEVIVRA